MPTIATIPEEVSCPGEEQELDEKERAMSARWFRILIGAVVLAAVMVPGTTISARTTYPTVAVTLGTVGASPSHPNGWWIEHHSKPWWYDDFTSFCRYPGTFENGKKRPTWGLLTHPQGYEIWEGGYGMRAYLMYDASIGWIRPANVWPAGVLNKPKLVAPGRIDTCGVPPGAGRLDPPPDEEQPPAEGLGGNDSIVGTYSCNVPEASREQAQITELHERGTLTITPAEGEPREGTWWSTEEDSVFISFGDETVRFTIERDRLAISGFACNLVNPTR